MRQALKPAALLLGTFLLWGAVHAYAQAPQAIPVAGGAPGSALSNAGYPAGATPLTATATLTTGAGSATLGAQAGARTYICGFSINANATGGIAGNASVSGLATSINFLQGVAVTPLVAVTAQQFSPCIPASVAATSISVNAIAAGSGGNATVSAWGFQQ